MEIGTIYSVSYKLLIQKIKKNVQKKNKTKRFIFKNESKSKKISNIENSVQKICLEELILICFFLDLNFSQIIIEYERDYILENIDKMK